MHAYVYVRVCVKVCTCVCMYVCMYVCVYECVYVCVCVRFSKLVSVHHLIEPDTGRAENLMDDS